MGASTFGWIEQLHKIPRWARVTLLVAIHGIFFTLAYMMAFVLRFDFQVPAQHQSLMWSGLLPMLAVKLSIFAALRMFQGWWKYVSLYDLVSLFRALMAASGAWLALNFFLLQPSGFPRSIYILDFVLCLFLIGGVRGSLRLFRETVANRLQSGPQVPVLIAGAGDTGEALMREIARNRNIAFRPVGFLDDDPYKLGLRLHGARVLGTMDAMPSLVEKHGIKEVIIAMPSADRKQIRRVVDMAHRTGVKARIVPAFEAVVEGNVSVTQLREVAITDLLGRAPVELDTVAIGRFLEGRRVLVTGAGGSIGSEICRQVLRFNPDRLVLVDSAETPLFLIHRELRDRGQTLHPTIADVTHRDRMARVFEEHRPEVVLHAAAYKHVPLMEAHPSEAALNNLGGTRVVAELASEHKARAFVLISTDKAVNPTSVMGATKRASEIFLHHHAATAPDTKFCAVRFGNVLGSNGSVIPIFRRQIKNGGPVTVTHPEMTRYFMTIPEATQLVLQAASFDSGDLFILDMGEPVKIVDLARDMIRLSGFSVDEIPIEFSGVRPGEKLFEELTLDRENVERTGHEKIFVGKQSASVKSPEDTIAAIEALLKAAADGEDCVVVEALRGLIPTYGEDHREATVVPLRRTGS